jgi:hypothetical protein
MALPRRPTPDELLDSLKTSLTNRLPPSWSVDVRRHTGAYADRIVPDATLTVSAPDGRTATIPVEITERLDPRDVATVAARVHRLMRDSDERPLILTPYITYRTRKHLVDNNLSYATSSPGSIHLTLRSPAVYIDDHIDVEKDPWAVPRDQPLRTLRGPTAGRVVRALCDFRPPYGVQELAERADTPIASVSRVLSLLDTEALIVRAPRGAVTDVQWVELIRRWTQDYIFSKANTVSTYLEPRGVPALLEKLRKTDLNYAVTGSMAAARIAPITVPRLLVVYVDRRHHVDTLDVCARSLGLRPAERGANVVLAEPFNLVVFDRTQEADGIRYAAPSQVAADLLTGPGRSPAEADALLQWMAENEDAWRA